MRLRISFKTLTLLCHSETTLPVWGRYLAGRLARLGTKIFGHGAGDEVAAAQAVFAGNIRGLEFSHTWFDGSIPLWVKLLSGLKATGKPVEILEIGSWEGRSTVFLLGYFPNGRLTAVDTWQGGDEHRDFGALSALEQRFDANVAAFGGRVEKMKGLSSMVLAQIAGSRRECFDLIYVDGSHFADDVMLDAVFAWRLLRQGGIMIFDDYLWRIEQYGWKKNPARAVNLFLRLCKGDFDLLHAGYQLAIRKTVSITKYTGR